MSASYIHHLKLSCALQRPTSPRLNMNHGASCFAPEPWAIQQSNLLGPGTPSWNNITNMFIMGTNEAISGWSWNFHVERLYESRLCCDHALHWIRQNHAAWPQWTKNVNTKSVERACKTLIFQQISGVGNNTFVRVSKECIWGMILSPIASCWFLFHWPVFDLGRIGGF